MRGWLFARAVSCPFTAGLEVVVSIVIFLCFFAWMDRSAKPLQISWLDRCSATSGQRLLCEAIQDLKDQVALLMNITRPVKHGL